MPKSSDERAAPSEHGREGKEKKNKTQKTDFRRPRGGKTGSPRRRKTSGSLVWDSGSLGGSRLPGKGHKRRDGFFDRGRASGDANSIEVQFVALYFHSPGFFLLTVLVRRRSNDIRRVSGPGTPPAMPQGSGRREERGNGGERGGQHSGFLDLSQKHSACVSRPPTSDTI